MRSILFAIILMICSSSHINAQFYTLNIPSSRTFGFNVTKLVETPEQFVFTGYDIPDTWDDPVVNPPLIVGYKIDKRTGSIINQVNYVANPQQNLGYVLKNSGGQFIAQRYSDIDSDGNQKLQLISYDTSFSNINTLLEVTFVPDFLYGSRPEYILSYNAGYILHLNGKPFFHRLNNSFQSIDSVAITYPNGSFTKNTPMLLGDSLGHLRIYHSITQSFNSNCFTRICNTSILRKMDSIGSIKNEVLLPILAQFPFTNSSRYTAPNRVRDLKDLNSNYIIGSAEANTHNTPPYSNQSIEHGELSNRLVIFKINKNLDSNSFISNSFGGGNAPIYLNDEFSLHFKNENYIYLVGTKEYNNTAYFPELRPYFFTTPPIETGIVIFCVDSNLNLRWQEEIKIANTELHMIDMAATSDSGIVLLMHERQYTVSDELNLKLIKLDKYGIQSPGSSINESNTKSFKIFPNPTSQTVHLEFENTDQFNQVIFHNLQGQKVTSFNIETQDYQTLDISQLARGIYFVHLIGKNKTSEVKKLVIN